MKKAYGYIVQVENFQLPFDLAEFAKGEGLNLGQAYYQEDVLGSGMDDFVCWGIFKKDLNALVKTLLSKGVPQDNITVYRIVRED